MTREDAALVAQTMADLVGRDHYTISNDGVEYEVTTKYPGSNCAYLYYATFHPSYRQYSYLE